MPFNSGTLYQQYLNPNRATLHMQGINLRAVNRADRANGVLSGRTLDEQLELDCAMWYGTLQLGTAWKRQMLTNIFQTLHFGTLLLRYRGVWQTWFSSGLPVASALSHGGRVLIQLPRSDGNDAFWHWLWAGPNNIQSRWAATHGVRQNESTESLPAARRKRVEEIKKGGDGAHFGVNIGVGGVGNVNPFSGNKIAEDGEHGHLYLYYLRPTLERNGAILVGVEDSAPLDRFGHSDRRRGLFAMGQSGHKHTFGSSGTYSATGGKKWEDIASQSGGRAVPGAKIDAMFVDLASVLNNFPSDIQGSQTFQPAWLGNPTLAPPPAINPGPVPARIPTPTQWKVIGKDVIKHRAGLFSRETPRSRCAGHLTQAIASYQGAPVADNARQINYWCMAWINAFGPSLVVEDLQARAMAAGGEISLRFWVAPRL